MEGQKQQGDKIVHDCLNSAADKAGIDGGLVLPIYDITLSFSIFK